MEEEDDARLMQRLAEGEEKALNDLMERWQKPLVSFVTRYVKNREDALDLAQETFVRVYRHRKRYRPTGQFSTWLFTIAANLCRNHARWQTRHPTLVASQAGPEEKEDLMAAFDQFTDTPDQQAVRREETRLIESEVRSLPHDLRVALLLSVFEGLPHQQIAGVLGCSPKAVEMRIYRARKQLQEALEKARSQPTTPSEA